MRRSRCILCDGRGYLVGECAEGEIARAVREGRVSSSNHSDMRVRPHLNDHIYGSLLWCCLIAIMTLFCFQIYCIRFPVTFVFV